MMRAFSSRRAVAVGLNEANVDTDQILPGRFPAIVMSRAAHA